MATHETLETVIISGDSEDIEIKAHGIWKNGDWLSIRAITSLFEIPSGWRGKLEKQDSSGALVYVRDDTD